MVLGLFASACGAETAPIEASSDVGDQSVGSDQAEAPDESTGSAESAEAAEPPAEPAEEAAGPAPVGEHFFPNLTTVDIATGSTINLSEELAGGDTPVLLWFFAPH